MRTVLRLAGMRTRLAFLALGAALACGCAGGLPRTAAHPLLGERLRAPTTTGASPDCAPTSESFARPTVVLVWSPWCASCKVWLTAVDRFWRQGGASRVRLVGVPTGAERADVERVLVEYDVSFPQAHDSQGAWVAAAGLDSVPRLLILDRGGRLRYVSPDDADAADVDEACWRAAEGSDGEP